MAEAKPAKKAKLKANQFEARGHQFQVVRNGKDEKKAPLYGLQFRDKHDTAWEWMRDEQHAERPAKKFATPEAAKGHAAKGEFPAEEE